MNIFQPHQVLLQVIFLVICLCFSGCVNSTVESTVTESALPSTSPYYHQIYSATSTDGLNWTTNDSLLFDHASVPGAVYLNGNIYLYFVNAEDPDNERISVAISTDNGQSFAVPTDVAFAGDYITYGVDPNPYVDNGLIRLTVLGNFGGEDMSNFTIVTTESSDGINFSNESAIAQGYVYTDPDLFKYSDVTWNLLVVNAGTLIRYYSSTPTSSYTLDPDFSYPNYTITSTFRIGSNYYTYYTGGGIGISIFDGTTLTNLSSGVIDVPAGLDPDGTIADPTVIQLAVDSYIMYFKYQPV